MKCCICGEELTNFGNNASPIKDGRCCDNCNKTFVIRARLKELEKRGNIEREEKNLK